MSSCADELREIAALTEELIDRYIRDWRPRPDYSRDLKPTRDAYPRASDFVTELGTKLVITNIGQANNAYRLGKIDRNRLSYSIRRNNEGNEREAQIENQLSRFAKKIGFAPLPERPPIWIANRQVVLVAAPWWNQDRVAFLSDEQKCEYYQAFSERAELNLVKKYQRVRGNEILLALIKTYESANLDQIRKEIDFFLSLSALDLRWYHPYDPYGTLRRVYDHLKHLPRNLRRRKLALLTEMDDLDKPLQSAFFCDFGLRSGDGDGPPTPRKRIRLDEEYAQFLELHPDELMAFQSSSDSPLPIVSPSNSS